MHSSAFSHSLPGLKPAQTQRVLLSCMHVLTRLQIIRHLGHEQLGP